MCTKNEEKWISVEDSLPTSHFKIVLATYDELVAFGWHVSNPERYGCLEDDEEFEWCGINIPHWHMFEHGMLLNGEETFVKFNPLGVTHWMEIPKPPK